MTLEPVKLVTSRPHSLSLVNARRVVRCRPFLVDYGPVQALERATQLSVALAAQEASNLLTLEQTDR